MKSDNEYLIASRERYNGVIKWGGVVKKITFSIKQREVFRKVLIIISFAVFLFSLIMIVRREIDSYKTEKLNNELSKIHEVINIKETTNIYNDMTDEVDYLKAKRKEIDERNKIEEEKNDNEINNQIQQLKKINSDIKGWIRIDNTQINNPVVQTVDNSFYLEHDVGKSKNSNGTIFIDEINDVSSPQELHGQNIILYGHHMKNGSMFGTLEKFRGAEFFKENETIYFDLFPNTYRFQVFGVFLVNEDFDYRNTMLGNEENINNFLNRLKINSLQNRDVTLTTNDTILTLSTCEYDFADARLVVMAKLITNDER
ncbi:class B sortase [Neobacillus sp. 179-J 1A1 HS]|uniref:class B sortase n=1 Tax=Neobacillus driksii TaxID=3035913 RepID=UPI0035BBA002